MAYCKEHDKKYALYCSGCRKERKEERKRERERDAGAQFARGEVHEGTWQKK